MEDLETQFHLRLPKETHGKVKQRAKMNGRSINAEITLIIEEALAQPPKITGFRDDAERLAHEHAEQFKKVVVETLTTIYRKDE
ncbi:Arc family DNA-binding protein [Serratia marcescens]|uniref:Arc family DNA-binding protein n=1 Tax=Serratia marcescens TaxID=615 RepID=UPI00198053DE|nr:Arc family DNA-binding protein [Serratia marcescens]EHT9829647.1 Arc family DNA-binding protein [Serratia marcescens]EIU0970870.1 Arc family DNA-binding protein [Serratia marcescens]EMB7753318.1 Arc family DNA-binding protein [Serratia marcescens]MBN3978537.1 Arc family DNA-binding protein [Serratia marcescens]MDP8762172.1 Arc family DNA-binding protein [Serratia marcescens]